MTEENKKPTVIQHQENHNCQIFQGPVNGAVFAMPGATVNYNPTIATQPEANTYEAKETAALPQGIEAVRPLLDKVCEAEDERNRARLIKVIETVLKDKTFAEAFKTVTPRGFKGGYNQKLLLNLLGMLHDKGICSLSYNSIKPIVSPVKEVGTYFVNYNQIGETYTALTKEMLARLEEIIR